MPTQFTATVKPSGGDYTSLNSAVTGLANDLTLATIKVFSISASTTPTIAAGDTVLGQTSLATGVCVLVNAARTQILIKTIAVASFLSGEIVQKTADANVNVTLSNTGDSPIIGIECYSMSDTTPVDISGYTTSSTNYIYIYTPISERHNGKWSPAKYSLEYSGGDNFTNLIYMGANDIKIDGLQLRYASDSYYGKAIFIEGPKNDCNISISNTIIIGDSGNQGININNNDGLWTGTNIIKIWNNIIYGFNGEESDSGFGINHAGGATFSAYIYNNTVSKCTTGIKGQYSILTLKNNISYNNTNNYNDTFDDTSTHNVANSVSTSAWGVESDSGITDDVATNKLIDSDQNFLTTVKVGMVIKNVTDTTYTYVTAIDSNSQLSLNDDIFISEETYTIYTNRYAITTFIDETNNDFHLASNDTGARNYGTDLSGDINLPFSTDIDGQTRPGQLIWDVGADEYFPIHNYGYILC